MGKSAILSCVDAILQDELHALTERTAHVCRFCHEFITKIKKMAIVSFSYFFSGGIAVKNPLEMQM